MELPHGQKPSECKWVSKIRYGSDGRVEHFKGRLVAKGHAQKYGIDYGEAFSPVVHFSSICILLVYAVQDDMLIHQMDVVAAFLNENLDEELHIQQPDCYMKPGEEHLMYKLKNHCMA